MDWTPIEDALYDFTAYAVNAITPGDPLPDPLPVPVIWEDQAATRPDKPYLTIDIISVTRLGWDDRREGPDEVTDTVVGNRPFTFNLQSYGTSKAEARGLLSAIVNAFQSVSYSSLLQSTGVVFYTNEGIEDVSKALETEWEPRFSLDVSLGVAESFEDVVGAIESTEMEGTAKKDVSGPTVWQDTFTVTKP